MSLTSYRAAPPRVNDRTTGPLRRAGTYSRFEEDVKGGLRRLQISRFRHTYMGPPPRFVNLFWQVQQLIGWSWLHVAAGGRRAEPIRQSESDVVRPDVGIQ